MGFFTNIFSGKVYNDLCNVRIAENGETFIKMGNQWIGDDGSLIQKQGNDWVNLDTGVRSSFGDPFDKKDE